MILNRVKGIETVYYYSESTDELPAKGRGIVFTEFLEMVEEKFGYEMVDTLLLTSTLPSGGMYTSVGTLILRLAKWQI